VKALAVKQFHHEEWMARFFTHVVDSADIRVIERASGADLPLETPARSISGRSLRQNFDGHLAIESQVSRLIYLTQTSRADKRKDLIGSKFVAGRESHMDFPRLAY
jgi:hypothetical protein